MTHLDRQIRTAQHRLWFNRWLSDISFLLVVTATIFALVVLVQRLFDFTLPLFWIGSGLGIVALLASIILTLNQRENASTAAAALDEAAGLRERLSTGQFCSEDKDPFARAVVADAEHVSSSISARQHIRFTTPKTLAMSVGSVILAAMMFFISPGLLKSTQATQAKQQTDDIKIEKVAVKRKMQAIRQMAETTPALDEFQDKIDALNNKIGGSLTRPGDLRHEAVKKIDSLTDAIKQKQKSAPYEKMKDMRKMLRGLKTSKSAVSPTEKLAKALSNADYKTAREEILAIKEQLATLKTSQDKEMVHQLSKQLEQLARQLKKLAKNDQLVKKLQQAGIKKEDLDRLLENLSKKDLDQLKKQLKKKGLSQKKIEKIAKQLQQRKQSGGMANKIANAMKQSAQSAQAGQIGDAQSALSIADGQLSELEQLEQEMSQLETSLSSLQNAKNDLSKPCGSCKGTGKVGNKSCGRCQGSGGMGKLGQGRGGLAPEQQTNIGFKIEKGKVHTGKGAIIGQFLFDGEQVKGDISTSLSEVVSAADRDASDRISRDRIPRQYHKAVKNYFSNMQRSMNANKSSTDESKNDLKDSTSSTPNNRRTKDSP